jgi:hypothetical protein
LNLTRQIIVCLTGLLLWTSPAEGQLFRPNTEVGVFVGVSYYQGDINPRRQMYAPGMSFGALLKHNFTEHHCLRVNLFYGQLQGSDLDFTDEYRQMRAQRFETQLLDCHLGWEFNFLPYITNRRKPSHTPYIFAALGYSLILSSNTGMAKNHATIPFGVGYKYRISNAVAIGCEWGLRKTFTDKLDGVLNPGPGGSYSNAHNNDWYSFAGVYITFKVFEKGFACPGIKEQTIYQ